MRLRAGRPAWPPAADTALAAALAVFALAEVFAVESGVPAGTAVPVAACGVVAAVTLAWRRRTPLLALGVVLVAMGARSLLAPAVGPLGEVFAVLVASYSTGAHRPVRRGAVGILAAFAVLSLSLWRDPARHHLSDWLFAAVLIGGAWGLGAALRRWRGRAHLLAEDTVRLAADRDRVANEAVRAERARIARELHDIVAHSVTTMVLNTGLVRRRIGAIHPDEAALLTNAEHTGRQALAELRRLLDLLRDANEGTALAPYPGLAQLPDLLDRLRATGLAVTLHTQGTPAALPPGVDLTAYRIVQEALTNVAKHTDGASAQVVLRYAADGLHIAVTDTGPGMTPTTDHRAGHGLIGMGERVAVYGGRLRHGPCPGGGYEVRASLPTDEVPQ